jgi:Ni,Fe-hydrogenase I cytochrome b subunit
MNSILGLFLVLASFFWIYSNLKRKRINGPLSRLAYFRTFYLAIGLLVIGILLLSGKFEIV